jgi:hypothetical protein
MTRTAVPNRLAQQIEETLRPVVGTVLATVCVDVESKRIGKDPESIGLCDLDVISENLIGALRLVVGQAMAESAAAKVRSLS